MHDIFISLNKSQLIIHEIFKIRTVIDFNLVLAEWVGYKITA